jgi:hypothetical protein
MLRALLSRACRATLTPCLAVLAALGILISAGRAAEITIVSPQPWQVIQRNDASAANGRAFGPGGSAVVRVVLAGEDTFSMGAAWEARVGVAMMPASEPVPTLPWRSLTLVRSMDAAKQPGTIVADVVVPAGGWYR